MGTQLHRHAGIRPHADRHTQKQTQTHAHTQTHNQTKTLRHTRPQTQIQAHMHADTNNLLSILCEDAFLALKLIILD